MTISPHCNLITDWKELHGRSFATLHILNSFKTVITVLPSKLLVGELSPHFQKIPEKIQGYQHSLFRESASLAKLPPAHNK